MKSFKEHLEEKLSLKMPRKGAGLGVPRNKMPQIHEDHYQEYVKYLSENGITLKKGSMNPHKLKPIQKEFSETGVLISMRRAIIGEINKEETKSIIISSDNYVIDGHHRWLAFKNLNTNIPVMQANTPMKILLAVTNKFPKVTYKGMHA